MTSAFLVDDVGAYVEKAPDEIITYTIDWSDWLVSDTIATSAWTIDGGDVTASDNSNDTTTATVELTGGVLGRIYRVTNQITTAATLTAERSFRVKCRHRNL